MKQLYRSYSESTDIFKDLENKYSNYIKLESIGQTWEKRDINLITISKDIKTAHTRPALFFTGTIHAREWVGHEVAIEFTKYVLENYENDPTIQSYLENTTNFDGLTELAICEGEF